MDPAQSVHRFAISSIFIFIYIFSKDTDAVQSALFPIVDVLTEEVIFPALAAAGDEEPVVVEPHGVAAQLVPPVAVDAVPRPRPRTRPGPLQQVLVVVGRRRCLGKIFLDR